MRWKADRKGRLVWVNHEWENFSGVSLGSIEGQTGDLIVHPYDRLRINENGMKAWAELRPFAAKFKHWNDGKWVQCLVYTEPVFENGIFRGYDGITEVVTNPCVACPAFNRFDRCCKTIGKIITSWAISGLIYW